jgi:hypothetical protein
METTRFETLDDAVLFAKIKSRGAAGTVTVLESPSAEHPDKPYLAELGDGGIIRSWERCHGTFVDGKRVRR